MDWQWHAINSPTYQQSDSAKLCGRGKVSKRHYIKVIKAVAVRLGQLTRSLPYSPVLILILNIVNISIWVIVIYANSLIKSCILFIISDKIIINTICFTENSYSTLNFNLTSTEWLREFILQSEIKF